MTRRSLALAAATVLGWLSASVAAGPPDSGPAADQDTSPEVQSLIVKLGSTSPATRATAAKALGEMGPKAIAAVGALKQRTADKDEVRIETRIDGIAMTPAHLQPTTTVGCVAAGALFRIDPSAVMDVLRTGPESARSNAAEAASARIDDRHGFEAALLAVRDPADTVRLMAVGGLVRSKDPRALTAVVEATGDAAPRVRGLAIDTIGRRGGAARHADRLVEIMLRDGHPYPRGIAAYYLGEVDNPKVIRALTVALRDSHAFVRAQAADSLGQHFSDEATEAFIQAMGDRDKNVLKTVLRALLCVRDPRASAAAVGLINHNDLEVRECAAKLVGYYPDRYIDVLLRALEDKRSCSVRYAAAEALGRTAKPDGRIVPALVRRYRKEGDDAYRRALAALGTPEAVNTLKEFLFDERHHVLQRAMIARALGTVGTPEARAALAQFTHHSNDQLSLEARRGLQDGARKEYKRTPTLLTPVPRNRQAGAPSRFSSLEWDAPGRASGGGARSKGAVAGGFVLSGIMGSGAGGAAIINGKIVRVGDDVAGAKVAEITRTKVRLDAKGREVVLTMK